MTQGGPFLVETPWSHQAGKRQRAAILPERNLAASTSSSSMVSRSNISPAESRCRGRKNMPGTVGLAR